MLELVFSDADAGALKVAKGMKGSSLGGVRVTFNEDGTTTEEPFGPEIYDGPELEGSSQDVLGLPLMLDIGPLAKLEASRPALWESHFAERTAELTSNWPDIPAQPAPAAWAREQLEALQQALPRLLQAANTEGVRVWYSASPGDLCGFYWAMHLLQNATGPVLAVKLPECTGYGGEYRRLHGVGECTPEMLPLLAEGYGREVPPGERAFWAAEWERLAAENGPLRAVVNGVVQTVGEDFYDFVLRANMPEGVFRISDAIVNCIVNGPLGIGDLWYAARLRRFIAEGALEVVEECPGRFYSTEVRSFPTVL